jgi:GMP synthase (glutamine-hydrolysing)
MAQELGGKVQSSPVREYGRAHLYLSKEDLIFDGLDRELQVWMSHGDAVIDLPEGFATTAFTRDCEVAAMSDPARAL